MSLQTDLAPVRIGVAGLGLAGTYHLERLGLRDDCLPVAIFDDCPGALIRAPAGAPRAHRTWSDFLSDDNVELVLVAAPPVVHAELAISALSAGKHVVMETPLCLNLYEADAIAAAAERSARKIFVAHTQRWDDEFCLARKALDSGALGEPRTVKFVNWHYHPPVSRESHRAHDPADGWDEGVYDWRSLARTGGGVLWERGVHYFDQLLQLVGRPPHSVFARFIPDATSDCDDGFLAILNFSGGLTAHIEACRVVAAPLATGWMIHGTRGSYADGNQFLPQATGEVVDIPLSLAGGLTDEFYRQVVRHLRCDDPNPVPLDQSRQVIAVVEAVRRSAVAGQVIDVDLAARASG